MVTYANGNIQYFDYDGKTGDAISQVGYKPMWHSAVTYGGRTFMPIAANPKISACFSPAIPPSNSVVARSKDKVLWAYPMGKSCLSIYDIKPTPSGGFMALVVDSETSSSGKRYLIHVDFDGELAWKIELPLKNSTNTRYHMPLLHVTDASDAALTIPYTNGDSNLGVKFMLLDGASRAEKFVYKFSPSPTAGSRILAGNGDDSVAITDGQAYFSLKTCQFSTNGGKPDCSGKVTVNKVSNTNLRLDYPKSRLLRPKPATKIYYALGDSFSSGEGVEPFEADTDVPEPEDKKNLCHRSEGAYAKLLDKDEATSLQLSKFAACSGAETNNVLFTPKYTENVQIANIAPDANAVTISIGGNDIWFSEFVIQCLFLDCSQTPVNSKFFSKVTYLNYYLDEVYDAVLNEAPNAQVYVVGYPQLLPLTGCSSTDGWMKTLNVLAAQAKQGNAVAIEMIVAIGRKAGLLDNQVMDLINAGKVTFSSAEVAAARSLVAALDAKIQATVAGMGSSRMTYVDPLKSGSPFAGHELCTGSSYFNGLVLDGLNAEYSFHPNAEGQRAYYRLVKSYLLSAG